MEVLTVYKVELAKRKKKMREMAEVLNMKYDKLSRVINGYDNVPDGFDAAARKWFQQLDEEARS